MRTTTPLAHATRLARDGRHDEARHALDELGGAASDDPAVLDLLARVLAQQGDLAGAEACWRRVHDLDPDHQGAVAGLFRIRSIWDVRRRPAKPVAAVAAAIVLLGVGGVAGWAVADRELDQLSRQVHDLRADLENRDPHRLAELRSALDGPGRTADIHDGSVTVMLSDPIFRAGSAELNGNGDEALRQAARTLARAGSVDLTVVGHTSGRTVPPGSTYADDIDLGHARAQVAAALVADSAALPLGAIGIASTGGADTPYPNITRANRNRNQTVTLLVRPVPEGSPS